MYLDVRGLPTIGYGVSDRFSSIRLFENSNNNSCNRRTVTYWQAAEPIETTLNNLIGHGLIVTQNQFDALADFCYNCGTTAFLNSTLLKGYYD